MPRLVVRKSSLSTTHYCRRWILGNSAKTPRRKTSVADDQGPRDSSRPLLTDRREGTRGFIAGGLRVLLRQFGQINRKRCAFSLLLFVFFTFVILRFSDQVDDDGMMSVVLPADIVAVPEDELDRLSPPLHALSLDTKVYRLARPNCSALALGDLKEIHQIEQMLYKETQQAVPNNYFTDSTMNCSHFQSLRGYPKVPYSTYEADHPLAYLVAVKEHAEQVERLIRAIYSPQNIYCLYSLNTTSSYTSSDLELALRHISDCFPNIIMAKSVNDASQRRRHHAPFENCLKAVLVYPKWQHVLMIAEGYFPLATNREIIDTVRQSTATWRTQRKSDNERLLPPLSSNNDYSGYVITRKMAALASRGLADHRLSKADDDILQDQLQEVQEFLNLKIRAENSCRQEVKCVLKSSDLHWLLNQPYIFARKFDLQSDYVVVHCLERKLEMRNNHVQNWL